MTTSTRPARTHRSPDGAFASEGGARQEGPLPIYVCNTCHRLAVWATSRRTGRKYLATVRHGYLDQRYYVKAQPHECVTAYEAERNAARITELTNAIASIEAIEVAADDPRRSAIDETLSLWKSELATLEA